VVSASHNAISAGSLGWIRARDARRPLAEASSGTVNGVVNQDILYAPTDSTRVG